MAPKTCELHSHSVFLTTVNAITSPNVDDHVGREFTQMGVEAQVFDVLLLHEYSKEMEEDQGKRGVQDGYTLRLSSTDTRQRKIQRPDPPILVKQ